ncbi:MAG: GNAT family N-acetyltransferase [Oscillochloridaceae bacterium]|nr:GNAT family N-acetyltransferase [Chloroflexaceae bacterium]MDW8388771.1 GNAT family N-acetyltransferase [Oscillochloridaceae bacterium]
MHQQDGTHVLYGPRVALRPWLRSDTLMQELWPRYTEPFNSLWNIPRASGADEVNGRAWSSQRYAWAIDDAQRRLIGRISLREVDEQRRSARLGISLAQPYVGQGLGTEALQVFLEHYFGTLGFQRLRLDVAAVNRRAVRCYERLGFRYLESEWRNAGSDPSLRLLDDPRYSAMLPHFRRSRFENLVEFYEMELTRAEWEARRAASGQ